jgi:hypothetical protein
MPRVNWTVTGLDMAEHVVCALPERLTPAERLAAITGDDTFYGRTRGQKTELLTNTFDHAGKGQKYKRGFSLLTLAWTDGVSLVPLLFRPMSSEKQKNRCREIDLSIDKRSCGCKARAQTISTMPNAPLQPLATAAKSGMKAKRVLFGSWFS